MICCTMSEEQEIEDQYLNTIMIVFIYSVMIVDMTYQRKLLKTGQMLRRRLIWIC